MAKHYTRRREVLLLDFVLEKLRHPFKRYFGFRQLEVIPESMRQGFKDHQLRVAPGSKQGVVKDRRVAQQDVARAGDEETGWHPVQIGKQRRQHWISAVRLRYILFVWQ